MENVHQAKALLTAAGISIDQSFDALDRVQMMAIRAEASIAYERKYGKTMPDDSDSYIRKRYNLLQQRARS